MLLKELFSDQLELVDRLEKAGYETSERLIINGEVFSEIQTLLELDEADFELFSQRIKENIDLDLLHEMPPANFSLGCLGEQADSAGSSPDEKSTHS